MASLMRTSARRLITTANVRVMSSDGAIRDAGGVLSDKEKAEENMYFRQLQAQQLRELKRHHDEEIQEHEKDIKRLQERIETHKKRLKELEKH